MSKKVKGAKKQGKLVKEVWLPGLFMKLSQAGDYQDALSQFQSLLQSKPRDPSILFQIGIVHSIIGKNKRKAIEVYSLVLSLDPNDDSARFNRGKCYQELGKIKVALADFTQCLQGGDDSSLRQSRGACYLALKKYKEAALDFKKAAEYLEREIELRKTWPQ